MPQQINDFYKPIEKKLRFQQSFIISVQDDKTQISAAVRAGFNKMRQELKLPRGPSGIGGSTGKFADIINEGVQNVLNKTMRQLQRDHEQKFLEAIKFAAHHLRTKTTKPYRQAIQKIATQGRPFNKQIKKQAAAVINKQLYNRVINTSFWQYLASKDLIQGQMGMPASLFSQFDSLIKEQQNLMKKGNFVQGMSVKVILQARAKIKISIEFDIVLKSLQNINNSAPPLDWSSLDEPERKFSDWLSFLYHDEAQIFGFHYLKYSGLRSRSGFGLMLRGGQFIANQGQGVNGSQFLKAVESNFDTIVEKKLKVKIRTLFNKFTSKGQFQTQLRKSVQDVLRDLVKRRLSK